ncbi:phosphonate C-P lyase system protein PhnG [Neoaquamicrobium sediminum]|uniref:phosphonate C-P lyase system protein PhnG n=1 Tax=Neoaquamicrobium sediminum TaxID=1849104 RepID=UPI003BAA1D01
MRHVNRSGNLGEARRAAMAVLAAVPAVQLHRCWKEAAIVAEAEALRGPETGLVAVRGRIGGGGAPFNVGEATVTRATVRLATGEVGHAYLLGRDAERARLAATVDALLQCADKVGEVEERVLAPLRALNAAEENRRRAETAATKVDFFTVARGED